MAQTFYQPNYATDRRFAPSGFTIPSGPSIEEQNRMANAPAPVARPVQQGQAPAGAANPMDTLNKTLGLNIGAPYEGSMMRQATDAMPQSDQLANGLRQAGGTAGISRWSTIMQDTGGLPDPTRPDFQQRQQAGIALFNRLQQQGLMDSQPSGFMPPSRDAYTGGGDSVTGQQALAAGGAELSGYGGTRVSGTPGINGGPNRFMLRQNPDTIPAEGSFTPPSNPVQAGPSAYQQSFSRYDAALAAMSKPKDNAPSGYRSNPDGSLSFIPGGPADPATKSPNLTQTQRNAEYAVEQGIKAGAITPEQKEEAVAVFSQELMGRAPKFPVAERDTAIGNAKYIQSLEALQAATEGVPDGGFGPIENRAKMAANSVLGTYKNYATVDQSYKEAGSTKAFGEGGKQLTNTEKEMTFGQIGDPNSEGFKQQLSTHMDRVRNQVNLQLERLKASPYRFTSEGQAAIAQLESALAGKTGGRESIKGKQDTAPKGVDAAVWSAMTPEEQVLWK